MEQKYSVNVLSLVIDIESPVFYLQLEILNNGKQPTPCDLRCWNLYDTSKRLEASLPHLYKNFFQIMESSGRVASTIRNLPLWREILRNVLSTADDLFDLAAKFMWSLLDDRQRLAQGY